MADEAEKFFRTVLDRVQRSALTRKALAGALALALLAVAGNFIHQLLPRTYALKVSGGDILGNRHLLTKVLQEELLPTGVILDINPMPASVDALEALDMGQLDLAFVPAGSSGYYPNVVHVATIAPELLHFLVRPGIRSIGDIRGRTVNLGNRHSAERAVATAVFEFSGLRNSVDYVETNFSNEQLLAMKREHLPDVLVVTSYVPSFIADDMVKQHGYTMLEMPFPESLAVRVGWVADAKVLGYMYGVVPPVPERDIKTIGVNIHLLANAKVDPQAIAKVLETLYSPGVESRTRLHNDEATLTTPSGFPLSAGSRTFLSRHDPLLSAKTYEMLKNAFGLLMSVLSGVLVVYKWLKGPERAAPRDDDAFQGFLAQAADLDAEMGQCPHLPAERRQEMIRALDALKQQVLDRVARAKLENPMLPQIVLQTIADTRAALAYGPVTDGVPAAP
ncbi:MAG: TAXI family TRAP transporter solute-binding subunit [Bacteroidales bacterium]